MGANHGSQHAGREGLVEDVGSWAGERRLEECISGVVSAVDEVQGADGAVKQCASEHKHIVFAGHVGGVFEGRDQVVIRGQVGVGGHGDAA